MRNGDCHGDILFVPQRIFLGDAQSGILRLTPQMLKRDEVLHLSTLLGEVDLLRRVDGFKS